MGRDQTPLCTIFSSTILSRENPVWRGKRLCKNTYSFPENKSFFFSQFSGEKFYFIKDQSNDNRIAGWEWREEVGYWKWGSYPLTVPINLSVCVNCGNYHLISGVIILIGVIIFGTKKELQIVINGVASAENYSFHAGFYLAIVGGILSFLAGLLLIFDKPISDRRREKAQEQDLAVFHDSSKRKVVGYHDYYETGHRPISVHNNGFEYADSRVLSTPEYRYYARSSRVKNFAL